jgi:hypothetical protein
MFVFLEKVKFLGNECGFEIYVPQDSLLVCFLCATKRTQQLVPTFGKVKSSGAVENGVY